MRSSCAVAVMPAKNSLEFWQQVTNAFIFYILYKMFYSEEMAGSLLPKDDNGRMNFVVSEPSRMLCSALYQIRKAFEILKTDNKISLALNDEFSNVIAEVQCLMGSCTVYQLDKTNGTHI